MTVRHLRKWVYLNPSGDRDPLCYLCMGAWHQACSVKMGNEWKIQQRNWRTENPFVRTLRMWQLFKFTFGIAVIQFKQSEDILGVWCCMCTWTVLLALHSGQSLGCWWAGVLSSFLPPPFLLPLSPDSHSPPSLPLSSPTSYETELEHGLAFPICPPHLLHSYVVALNKALSAPSLVFPVQRPGPLRKSW